MHIFKIVALWAVILVPAVGLLLNLSCMRSDVRTAVIQVPDMQNDQEVRIVTNAASYEISGDYDLKRHGYEVDVANRVLLYHEGRDLLSKGYQQSILAALHEVGFESALLKVLPNPTPAFQFSRDRPPIQVWPDRYTAIYRVRGMNSIMAANIAVDAVSHARLGRDPENLEIDRSSRTLLIEKYNARQAALKNIVHAINSVGFQANASPPRKENHDVTPHGWTPLTLLPPGSGPAGKG